MSGERERAEAHAQRIIKLYDGADWSALSEAGSPEAIDELVNLARGFGALLLERQALREERDGLRKQLWSDRGAWLDSETAFRERVEALELGVEAALVHARGLRMDTPEDEKVRLLLVETLELSLTAAALRVEEKT